MILSVTSGKGGVGKTIGSLSLAYHAGQAGYKTLLIDTDFGMSNISILLQMHRQHSAEEVISGSVALNTAVIDSRLGFDVLPSAYAKQPVINKEQTAKYLESLFTELKKIYDVIIVDTCGGIGDFVLTLNQQADHILVLSNLDPHSITDAYAQIKLMNASCSLVMTRCPSSHEANKAAETIVTVASKHLNISVFFAGYVPDDEQLASAVLTRNTNKMFAKNGLSSQAWCQISHKIFNQIKLKNSLDSELFVRRDPDEGTSQAV